MERFSGGYPMLVIGDAVTDFKKNFQGPIVSVKDIAELKEVIAYYSGIDKLDRVLVIEDISFLGTDANTTLLKFVEETRFQLVLLSRFDRVDEVLLSRIRSVEKYYRDATDSKFMGLLEANQRIEDSLSSDSHYFDKVRYMAKLAPKLLLVEKTIKIKRVKSKILSFVD